MRNRAHRRYEKICPGERPRYKKWLKRIAHRMMRRSWRRLGEDAPKRYIYYGWSI